MGAAILPILFFTALWAAVGIGGPMITPRGPQQKLTQCILMLTAVCCWLFWLCCYLTQMNPLIGPRLSKHAIAIIADSWNMPLKEKTWIEPGQ
ncbi:V-type proton ATPase subunit e [Drosophila grimshawi]|uniref:V-type proton ATPase subunit n=1 Tax=Drosophila grimshawi TaxID=7222 RepID=B4J1F6_DROGR|nr:V-type proton ATPase subunit e [Drosophila grimshawi]EDV95847.1 GH15548 [Drosophila grimshawi]